MCLTQKQKKNLRLSRSSSCRLEAGFLFYLRYKSNGIWKVKKLTKLYLKFSAKQSKIYRLEMYLKAKYWSCLTGNPAWFGQCISKLCNDIFTRKTSQKVRSWRFGSSLFFHRQAGRWLILQILNADPFTISVRFRVDPYERISSYHYCSLCWSSGHSKQKNIN